MARAPVPTPGRRRRGRAGHLVRLSLLAALVLAAWRWQDCARWVGRRLYPYPYRSTIEAAARRYDLDPLFVVTVVREESRFQAHARSAVGARGLMQLMPGTARWAAHKAGLEDYRDEQLDEPTTNVQLGCWLLHHLFQRFSDARVVLAAYNGGEGNASRWVGTSAAPYLETQLYVARGMETYALYRWLYPDDARAASAALPARLPGAAGGRP